MAKKIEQSLEWCENCEKRTLHYREYNGVNWLMHIALMIVGIGFITLPLALLGRAMNARIGGKAYPVTCSECGYEH